MGWLGKRKKPSPELEDEERRRQQEAGAKARSTPAGPPLILLVPDVAGVSSYRMHRLADAAAGAEFIQASLSWQKKSGIHAFWALQQDPGGDEESQAEKGDEAMVLIRTADGSDLVYVVSFVDIESAQSFARFEVKRGLTLGLILVYWACPVTITETAEGVQLSPHVPPRVDPRARLREARVSASAPAVAMSAGDQHERQRQEKRRLQAELAEMQRRQAIGEQRRLQLEEKKRLQAELAEMQRRQAEAEEARKQTEAERARRQANAEEAKSHLLEAEESASLQAEAEEIAQLKAQAQALRKLQAEAREIAKLKQEAEALRQQLAGTVEQMRREEQRQSATEEERRPASDGEVAGRRQAETEERQRLEAELADVQRRQAEAEERHRQAEAEETQRRAALQETRQQDEAAQLLPVAEQAMPGEHVEAGAEDSPRIETMDEPDDAIEGWPPPLPSDGRAPPTPWRPMAQQADEPAVVGFSRPDPGGSVAVDKLDAEVDRDERADGPDGALADAEERRVSEGLTPQEPAWERHFVEEASIAESPQELGVDIPQEFARESSASHVEEADETIAAPERTAWSEESAYESEFEAPEAAEVVEGPAATEAETPVQEPVTVGATRQEPLDSNEPDDDTPAEVAKLLGKRRWERRDSPFKGFESPPGRF